MDSLLTEALAKLVATVPSAVAVIVTVFLFLRAQRAHQNDHMSLTRELHERSTKCHEECTEAVKENREALDRMSRFLEAILETRNRRLRKEEGTT